MPADPPDVKSSFSGSRDITARVEPVEPSPLQWSPTFSGISSSPVASVSDEFVKHLATLCNERGIQACAIVPTNDMSSKTIVGTESAIEDATLRGIIEVFRLQPVSELHLVHQDQCMYAIPSTHHEGTVLVVVYHHEHTNQALVASLLRRYEV